MSQTLSHSTRICSESGCGGSQMIKRVFGEVWWSRNMSVWKGTIRIWDELFNLSSFKLGNDSRTFAMDVDP